MSCNGCRVLRKGCGDACVLRSSLRGIESPEAQAHATLFLAKFFGRSDLLSFISSVPELQRPVLFRSLLYEACGRTVSPVNGAVGLLSTGNWHLCEAAVDTVLAGGSLHPIQGILSGVLVDESSERFSANACTVQSLCIQSQPMTGNRASSTEYDLSLSLAPKLGTGRRGGQRRNSVDESDLTNFESRKNGGQGRKLLNLFV